MGETPWTTRSTRSATGLSRVVRGNLGPMTPSWPRVPRPAAPPQPCPDDHRRKLPAAREAPRRRAERAHATGHPGGVVNAETAIGQGRRGGYPPFAHRDLIVWGSSPWTKRGQPRLRRAIDRGGCSVAEASVSACRRGGLRCRGGRIRRCPHCATFPVDPSTDQCNQNPQSANGLMRATTIGAPERILGCSKTARRILA